MEFWRGNKADAGFKQPAAIVAEMFEEWWHTDEAKDWELSPLERTLRWWLTSPMHFNSVWQDENRAIFGEESFDGLYDLVYDKIYGKPKSHRR